MTEFKSFKILEGPGPVLIAGPCSAESRCQILSTAKALAPIPGINALRAGIWKPRTRPGSFEGIGKEGLPWLVEARAETGLEVIVEVAHATHVEACLKKGIRNFWIGARTTTDPISLEFIIDAMKGEEVSVLVKNPMCPDYNLWVGALERFYAAGISRLGAIHRGFYPMEGRKLRFYPHWELPCRLHQEFPELPVICDPSHLAGDIRYVPPISQRALDLGMDGLMVEVHPCPKEALSDASQQLDFQSLASLVSQLHIPDKGKLVPKSLEKLRRDRLDLRFLEYLLERFQGEVVDAEIILETWREELLFEGKNRLTPDRLKGLLSDLLEKMPLNKDNLE